MSSKDYIHKEFPKTCDPEDFFGQVKRTINGKPVPQEQIDMIVSSIDTHLGLAPQDALLDIGCGNGALSVLFFDKIAYFTGVDFSEYLIEVAKKHFEKAPDYLFHLSDAVEFLEKLTPVERYTKALCYGVFSYFTPEMAQQALGLLHTRYPNLARVYIGNLPDKDRAKAFFYEGIDYQPLLHDAQSAIGYWRSQEEFAELADGCGWACQFIQMPEGFYAAHYRYDVLLTRKPLS
jgi:cyclopropane fatty-acyl-phospholipid synthase-like methyltransferase